MRAEEEEKGRKRKRGRKGGFIIPTSSISSQDAEEEEEEENHSSPSPFLRRAVELSGRRPQPPISLLGATYGERRARRKEGRKVH